VPTHTRTLHEHIVQNLNRRDFEVNEIMDCNTTRYDASNNLLLEKVERLLMPNDNQLGGLLENAELTNWLPTHAADKDDFIFPLTEHRLEELPFEELSQCSLASLFQDDHGDHSLMSMINFASLASPPTRPYNHNKAKPLDSFSLICASPLNDRQVHTSTSLDKGDISSSLETEHHLASFPPEKLSQFSLASDFQDNDDNATVAF